jgi:hypothetical protein
MALKIRKRVQLAAALFMAAVLSDANDRPNVIVIMTDDTGNNIGFQGNPHVTTPHIDQLAIEGVNPTNFHQMPMCTASRAGLMSGQYAEQTGAWRTSQDVYWTAGKSGSQSFSQNDARKLKQSHGPYKVTVSRAGAYTITLSL